MAFQVQFSPKQIGCKSRVISVLYSITNMVRWRLWTLPFDFARLSTILLLSLLIDFWSVPKIIWPIFEGHQSKPSQENIFLAEHYRKSICLRLFGWCQINLRKSEWICTFFSTIYRSFWVNSFRRKKSISGDATVFLAPHLYTQILHAIFPLEISTFALLILKYQTKHNLKIAKKVFSFCFKKITITTSIHFFWDLLIKLDF